jgi:hypothetical protein
MNRTSNALALAVVFLVALAAMLAYAAFTAAGEQAPARDTTKWIYGPRQTLKTGQEGVIVYCQGKTNSRAFAERKHATPGDVVIQTCRAVRAPEAS